MPLTPRDRRATVLSTIEQADSISQVTIGPVMGVIGRVAGIPAALAASAALLAPSALAVRAAGRSRSARGVATREDRRVIVDEELVRRIEASAARVTTATVAAFIGHAGDDPARGVRVRRRRARRVRARPLRQPRRRRLARRHRRRRARRAGGVLRRVRRAAVAGGRVVGAGRRWSSGWPPAAT